MNPIFSSAYVIFVGPLISVIPYRLETATIPTLPIPSFLVLYSLDHLEKGVCILCAQIVYIHNSWSETWCYMNEHEISTL